MRRKNPQPRDHEKHLLKEHQVREILKFYREAEDGWHTKEWLYDLLRMPGSDKQVVRYLMKNIDWHASGVHIRGRSELENYIRELDEERYPEVEVGHDSIQELIKARLNFPNDIRKHIDQLSMMMDNLRLAVRLEESRGSIHKLRSRIADKFSQINYMLEPAEPEPTQETDASETTEASGFDCERCGEETFGWLDPEERRDVVSISNVPAIAGLQHQLRHLVMELREAAENKRPKVYIINLEDEIEDVHARMEGMRSRGGNRRNPDINLRTAERDYNADPTPENYMKLQTARIRAGMQQFYHDCDDCRFMQSEIISDINYDFYFCPRSDGGSAIARYGNDGPEYASWPSWVLTQMNQQGVGSAASQLAFTLSHEQGYIS